MEHWTEAAFVGGDPALDFLNTVDDHGKTRTRSRIADWPSFLAWARASQTFSCTELEANACGELLGEIHDLRETAYRVLAAAATGRQKPDNDLQRLERVIKGALSRADFAAVDGPYRWSAKPGDPHWLTDSLALALERLLRRSDLARLRQCGRCTWLFLDRGRGPGRRWCDMRTCGNRAKAEAFRKR